MLEFDGIYYSIKHRGESRFRNRGDTLAHIETEVSEGLWMKRFFRGK